MLGHFIKKHTPERNQILFRSFHKSSIVRSITPSTCLEYLKLDIIFFFKIRLHDLCFYLNFIKVFDVENFKITTVILFILENLFLVITVNMQQSQELIYI